MGWVSAVGARELGGLVDRAAVSSSGGDWRCVSQAPLFSPRGVSPPPRQEEIRGRWRVGCGSLMEALRIPVGEAAVGCHLTRPSPGTRLTVHTCPPAGTVLKTEWPGYWGCGLCQGCEGFGHRLVVLAMAKLLA